MGKVRGNGKVPNQENNGGFDARQQWTVAQRKEFFFRKVALQGLLSKEFEMADNFDQRDADARDFMVHSMTNQYDHFTLAGGGANVNAVRDPQIVVNPNTGKNEVRGPKYQLQIDRIYRPVVDENTGKPVLVQRMRVLRDADKNVIIDPETHKPKVEPVFTGAGKPIFDPKAEGTNQFDLSFRYSFRDEAGKYQWVDVWGGSDLPKLRIDMSDDDGESHLIASY